MATPLPQNNPRKPVEIPSPTKPRVLVVHTCSPCYPLTSCISESDAEGDRRQNKTCERTPNLKRVIRQLGLESPPFPSGIYQTTKMDRNGRCGMRRNHTQLSHDRMSTGQRGHSDSLMELFSRFFFSPPLSYAALIKVAHRSMW